MKKLMVNALNVGIAAALAIGLSACNRSADAGTQAAAAQAASAPAPATAPVSAAPAPAAPAGPQYAQVVSVTPVHAPTAPQQVCRDVVVSQAAPPKDQHNIAGTAIGAVAGGLLGHMVGGGRGNTLTTVAGAAAGGYAGNRIENANHKPQVTQSVQRQCSTVAGSDRIVGYDVQYVYNGVTRTTRMDHDPGNRVQVQEGVTAVSDAR